MIRFYHIPFLTCVLCVAWFVAQAQNGPAIEQFQRNYQRAKYISLDQTIAESKDLSDAERTGLRRAVLSKLRLPKSEVDKKAELDLEDEAAQSRVKPIDLGSNGRRKVFLVQGTGAHCSPTGNCAFWVFRGSTRGYSVILHGIGQIFAIQPTTANGLHDVVLGMHGSATMMALKLYRFNSARYTRAACYDERLQYVEEDGKLVQLDEPRITLCGQ